jgi:hypothetical protein
MQGDMVEDSRIVAALVEYRWGGGVVGNDSGVHWWRGIV